MDTSRETIENLIANQRRALVGMGGNIDVPALTEALERLLNERDGFRAQRDEARLNLKPKSPWPSCDEPSALCDRPVGHGGAHTAIRTDGVRMYWSNDADS